MAASNLASTNYDNSMFSNNINSIRKLLKDIWSFCSSNLLLQSYSSLSQVFQKKILRISGADDDPVLPLSVSKHWLNDRKITHWSHPLMNHQLTPKEYTLQIFHWLSMPIPKNNQKDIEIHIWSRHVTIQQKSKAAKQILSWKFMPYKEDARHSSAHSVLPDTKASHRYHSATNDSQYTLHVQLCLSFNYVCLLAKRLSIKILGERTHGHIISNNNKKCSEINSAILKVMQYCLLNTTPQQESTLPQS